MLQALDDQERGRSGRRRAPLSIKDALPNVPAPLRVVARTQEARDGSGSSDQAAHLRKITTTGSFDTSANNGEQSDEARHDDLRK